jgi:PAS domain S-box-containing protein
VKNTEQLEAMFQAVLKTSRDLEISYNELKRKFNDLEIKLENNRRYLENILKSINTGVCSVNLDCVITTFNKEACNIFETEEKAVKGAKLNAIFKLGIESISDLIGKFRKQTKMRIDINGKVKKISIASSPITDNDNIVGAAIIFSDITRVEELEEENRRKEKLAIIGQMAASIAHDIKNPLASIELLVSLLSDDSKKEIADNIMISIKRINNIINNTLLFTRTIIYRPEHFNSKGFMDDVEVEVYAHIKSKNIEFIKKIEDFNIVTDKNLLKSTVVNLIVNALDAARSRVLVNVYKDDDNAVFEIEDDGFGIDEDTKKHIFEPFYTNKKNGTGLGLSIVSKAVNIMSGKIDFTTGKNGTKFRVNI